jgi:primosomal protein N''
MKTRYGSIANSIAEKGFQQYVGKFFKILPMFEEKCPTLSQYIQSLNREMVGLSHLVIQMENQEEFLTLIATLEGLSKIDLSVEEVKSDVFKSISILKKMKSRVM